MKRTSGFTLIELLLTVTLTSIISLSVYSLFSSSIRVVLRMVETGANENLNIFSEKFERDLENTVKYQSIPFLGTSERLSFASPLDHGVGRTTIFFDPSSQTIQRQQENMNQLFSEKPGKAVVLFDHVRRARFNYLIFDMRESKYQWAAECGEEETVTPQAVQMELEFLNGDRKVELTRTFFIPIGD